MTSRKKIINGALFLGIGAVIAKILGAIYRIPLTNLLGAEGLGLYQMVFPVYSVLLDFSGAGVPSALSKIISEYSLSDKERYAKRILSSSTKLFAVIGSVFFLLMALFSKTISNFQGNKNAFLGYIFLAPAVFFVSLISCFRGYFQGLMNMKHTAISQTVEQVIKLLFGLILVNLFLPSIPLAVGGATLGVTISEVVALIYLYLVYKRRKRKLMLNFPNDQVEFNKDAKKIIKLTIPVTLIGIAIPLSHFIDSFLVVNILKTYTQNATSLYGLFSGVAHTVINLPVSVCYGLSVVAIPLISGSKSDKEREENQNLTLLLTLVLAIPLALMVYFFAPTIVNILFSGLSVFQKGISVKLIKILSVNVIFVSLLQSTNAILIGNGKAYYPLISMMTGVIINTVLNFTLLYNQSLNIYACGIASITCYFTAFLINLIMIISGRFKYAVEKPNGGQLTN